MRDAEIYDWKFGGLSGSQIAQFLHDDILHKKARSETERAFDHSDLICNFKITLLLKDTFLYVYQS